MKEDANINIKLPEAEKLEILRLKREGAIVSISDLIRTGMRNEIRRIKEAKAYGLQS